VKRSAGLLLYRRAGPTIEVLIAHPGGPFWARRDEGAWTIPKGQIEDGEEALGVARREFREETGHEPPAGATIALGEIELKSGKVVAGWAVEGDLDPDVARSNEFEVEWPPRSGRMIRVPEVDRVAWVSPAAARRLLNPAQAAFVDRLLEAVSPS
jgi:predicted NUDIX family NTP pyrophosphohydrolase